MTAKLTGAAYTYQTHLLYVGPLIASARHKHHAGQVMWVPDGLTIADEHRVERRVSTYLVPPDRFHSHSAAAAAAVLWVDRDDLQWQRVLAEPRDFSQQLPAALAAKLRPPIAIGDARALARELLEIVAPARGGRALAARHPAVERMCALLDDNAPEHDVSMTQLARQSGLSMRQLRHRFTEELGINPRAYLRWRRLRRALSSIKRGATLTEAAVEGGFADGAHFSRVYLATFGMAPSSALSQVQFCGSLD
jgi:AraC-like DNA-binding protein